MQNTYQGQRILRELASYRLQRPEVTQGGFPKPGQETGPLLNRPVCLQNKHLIAAILQLEARPHRTSSGCPINIVENHRPYMFPPFALIPRCLAKLHKEGISALIIAPVWPNQIWFPQFLNSLVDTPILLPPIPDIVTSPTGQNHPLATQGYLPLAAWPVSGDPSMQEDYQKELWIFSRSHGHSQQSQHTPVLGDSGIVGALGDKLIQLQPCK